MLADRGPTRGSLAQKEPGSPPRTWLLTSDPWCLTSAYFAAFFFGACRS